MANNIESIIDGIGFCKFNWKILFVVGMFWLMEGTEMTLISLVTPRLNCEWKLSTFQSALATSSVFVGMGLGSEYCGWLGDKYGRKPIMIATSVCIFYFAMLTSVADNITWFVLMRFIVGFCIGGVGTAICYILEFSPTEHRGKVIIGAQFFFAAGNFYAALMGFLVMNTLGWRAFVMMCTIPIPFTIGLIIWIPESIRYLQNTGKYDDITKVLHFISKQNDIPITINQLEIDCEDSNDRGSFKILLSRTYCKELIVLIFQWIIAWWCYFGVILLNTKVLQQKLSYPSTNTTTTTTTTTATEKGCHGLRDVDYLQNVIVSTGEFPGVIFFILVIEKLGRKMSLALSFFSTSVLFFVLTLPLSYRLSTVVMFLIRATSASIPQLLYVITTERFPTTIRVTALGFCFLIARNFLAALPFVIDFVIEESYIFLVGMLSVTALLCSLLSIILTETTGMILLNK